MARKRFALTAKQGSYCARAIWRACASGCFGWRATPGSREDLGRRGQQFVRDRFSVQQMVDDLYQLYLRLARPSQEKAEG